MKNTEAARELLETFRAWAESDAVTGRNDFDTLSHLVVDLFKEIEALSAIRFVVAQAQDYLPEFEQLNAEIRWPREVLAAVERLEPVDVENPSYWFFGDSRVYDENNVPVPGAAPFVDAVTALRHAPEQYRNQHEQNWNDKGALDVGMAFVFVIWARQWSEWASSYPEEVATFWAGRRSQDGGDEYEASLEDYVKASEIYNHSTGRKQICRRICLAAVNDLEVLLDSGEGP